MNKNHLERELIKKSNLLKEERQKFLEQQLNPIEKRNREFMFEVIAFYDIRSYEEFIKYDHLIPDCAAKLITHIQWKKGISPNE